MRTPAPGRTASRLLVGAEHWRTSEDEQHAGRACTAGGSRTHRTLTRGIDVDAPADVVFAWVCQLKVAPYSYDWINNLGRRSPRQLVDGVDRLAVGQRFLSLRIASFEPGREITTAASARELQLFGVRGFTYRVLRRGPEHSRILVRIDMQEPTSPWRAVRHVALAWGDLVMIRKQLRTLKDLAEQQAGAQR